MDHDVPLVYQTQKLMMQYLSENFLNVINVEYFTDGCAGQYKNCKTLLNLCYHEFDFYGISAKWNFFATSHGKSACDGIGGTVKRLVSKASLQRPLHDQIINVHKMHEYCKSNIKGIHFFFISNIEMIKLRKELFKRLQHAKTVSGTRSMHFFQPEGNMQIKGKRVSTDEEFSITASLDSSTNNNFDVPSVHSYVACVYDANWYIGMVLKVHVEEGDATIKFMHPHGPSLSYYWPKSDSCIVPFTNILCTVDINTTTGRTYKLNDESNTSVCKQWKKYFSATAK
nr:uncharacterized protein LOC122270073 [Parasteatoda tepidariorum]